jgi:hypothetical protein
MAFLLPCPSCGRHVRRTETACPFCAGAIAFRDAPLPRLPEVRLGRAATFAFGAAVATSVAACSGSVTPAYGAPAIDASSGVDAGSTVDAANPVDANIDTGNGAAAYGIAPFDAGDVDTGGSSSDYGAPPPP